MTADREGIDTEVASALDQGDLDHALSLLMAAYGKDLFRYCMSFFRDHATAEDAHQTTFVQAYQSLKKGVRPDSFRAWLYKVCRNRCLDLVKTTGRRRKRILFTDAALERVDEGPSFQQALEKREADQALVECLETLRTAEREAILLNFVSGHSFAEIGRILGQNAPAVRARIVRALPKLRRCIEKRGIDK